MHIFVHATWPWDALYNSWTSWTAVRTGPWFNRLNWKDRTVVATVEFKHWSRLAVLPNWEKWPTGSVGGRGKFMKKTGPRPDLKALTTTNWWKKIGNSSMSWRGAVRVHLVSARTFLDIPGFPNFIYSAFQNNAESRYPKILVWSCVVTPSNLPWPPTTITFGSASASRHSFALLLCQ